MTEMRNRAGEFPSRVMKAPRRVRAFQRSLFAGLPALGLLLVTLQSSSLAAAVPSSSSPSPPDPAAGTISLAKSLGIRFIPGSSSSFLIERGGKTYLVNLGDQTIQAKESPSTSGPGNGLQAESSQLSAQNVPAVARIFADKCASCHGADGKGKAEMKTPDFTNPATQAALSEAAVIKTIRDGKPGTAMPPEAGSYQKAKFTMSQTS